MNLASPDIPRASAATVRIQAVIYHLPRERAVRAVEFVDNAARIAVAAGVAGSFELAFGDCSPLPTFDETSLQALRRDSKNLSKVDATFFGANLGSAAGHNKLLAQGQSDFSLIMNPDVLLTPSLFVELLAALGRPGVGLAEARQLPVEHQKEFDPATGETSWCSTACLLAPTKLLRDLGGFDAETFFLYCDDVDLSWRARLAGHRIVYQPTAVCFHDKRLSDDGTWMAGEAERYYSAEAGLLLPYKYSRSDLTDRYLASYRKSSDAHLLKAAAAFDERKASGRLPQPLDPGHTVAQFINGNYCELRFQPR
jgi:GT2 family glycosyltransferase